MEELVKALLQASAEYGAGYLIAGLAIALYILERRAHLKEREAHMATLNRIVDLSAASISADKDTGAAIATLTRVLDSVDRRLEATSRRERMYTDE
jgi:hypothetical protein